MQSRNSEVPLLSIITVCLNDRNGLERTLNSVKQQLDPPRYEHIVIDGGSNDGSVELMRSAESRLAFWVSEPDTGIYFAMNKGVARAAGKYLLFLNSGDSLAGPDILRNVFVAFPEADIVYGTIRTVRNGVPGHFVVPPPPEQLDVSFWVFNTIQQSGAFIRRELLIKSPFAEDFHIVADRKFFFEAWLQGRSFARLPICMTLFDIGGVSSRPEFAAQKAREWDRLFTQHMTLPVLTRLRQERQRREARNRQMFGNQAMLVASDEELREALRHWLAFFFLCKRFPVVRHGLAALLRLAAWRELQRLRRQTHRSPSSITRLRKPSQGSGEAKDNAAEN